MAILHIEASEIDRYFGGTIYDSTPVDAVMFLIPGGVVESSAAKTLRTATNLKQQLALEEVISNSSVGNIVKLTMKDPRWKAAEGWVKMARDYGEFEIHWVYNKITHASDDFKIKIKGGK